LGAYRVLSLLGAGSEGEAYLVEDADGKNWALKVIKLPLPKKYVESMFREIQIQAELGEGHNNIIAAEVDPK
jgi:serine/threonine-protein kinase SRK2